MKVSRPFRLRTRRQEYDGVDCVRSPLGGRVLWTISLLFVVPVLRHRLLISSRLRDLASQPLRKHHHIYGREH